METVNIFVRGDTLQYFHALSIPAGSGSCTQNTVDSGIGIQRINGSSNSASLVVSGEIVAAETNPLFTRFACCRHKSATPGYRRPVQRANPGARFSGRSAGLHFFRNLRAYLLRNRFTVNNFFAIGEDSICIVSKGDADIILSEASLAVEWSLV